MLNTKTIVLVGLASLVAGLGCRPKQATNQELLAEYGGEKYQEDIVASDYEDTKDQGASIDPRTQAAIQDAIETVWVTDFESCLEIEMDRLGNRWVAGDFSIEFTIETSGMVSAAKLLASDIKERKTKNAKGDFVEEGGAEARGADGFNDCIVGKMYKWEFDPPPEVTYTHTYNGRVGEAW
ncbi:hypothetical protein ACNOYE_39865 [Nannocystaceae bacterium ST9]